ncbi:MAG: HU family DNA-binding protein [Stygiobacter sp.]|jgi:DNA-binding protein HU-beta|uniref:Integration host factor subunit beta n=1 Tax=Stygiobacter electus TaxID=3032292 RepID=A0AAE3NVK4_9BACT|nr:HU family DNA-binding protein [Stygiobacter electus]MDF1610866.1 integration host factor subunit beta [Stygiobacter electus]
MTKADIIDKIASGTGLTKIDTEVVVDGFFKTIIDALASGHGIEIRGFGSFKVRKKKSRNARNPRTGEKVYVGEHYVPAFKFSKDFKSAVDLGMKQLKEEQKVINEKM